MPMSAFNRNIKWGEDKEMSYSISVQEKIHLRSKWEVWLGSSTPESQASAEKELSDHGQSTAEAPLRLIKAI